MNVLLKVLIIASCLTLSSAYNARQLNQMLMWSWDNCRDQLTAYSNLVQTLQYRDDLQLFDCASAEFQSQYEQTQCEEEAKIKTKHDIIKNFYYVCVNNYEKFKNENKNSCQTDCFMQNFCIYFNKEKSDVEQYIDYINQKDITECDFKNCNEDTMNEIGYKTCTNSEIKCCEVDSFNSMLFDYFNENKIYLYFNYFLYLLNMVVIPVGFYSIVAFYRMYK